MMNTIKKNFIGNLPNLLLVGFLLIVACSSPVAHIPEINPEQLRAAPINDPLLPSGLTKWFLMTNHGPIYLPPRTRP